MHEYVHACKSVIDAVRRRGNLPILVGGTGYYVMSLLFRRAIVEEEQDGTEEMDGEGTRDEHLRILSTSTEEMYARLNEVDPEMARTWHPNDRRKIQRSLEIWLRTGKKPSEVYREQKDMKERRNGEEEGEEPESEVRYDPLIFWLEAEDSALKARLNGRVDAMVTQGLLKEVLEMKEVEEDAMANGVVLDQTKGIWVAIGYKQLMPLLNATRKSDDDKDEQYKMEVERCRNDGIEAMKSATRQYAKRQNRWIRIRFAKALKDAEILENMFLLDCTDVQRWDEKVVEPGLSIARAFLLGDAMPRNSSLSGLASEMFARIEEQDDVTRQVRFCEVCKKTLMSDQEWLKHLKSQTHKKVLAGIRKRAQRDEYLSRDPEHG